MGTFVERDRSFAQIISSNISWNKKSRLSDSSKSLDSGGAPGGTRTPDLLVRSQTLYPAELLAQVLQPYYYSRVSGPCQGFVKIFPEGTEKPAPRWGNGLCSWVLVLGQVFRLQGIFLGQHLVQGFLLGDGGGLGGLLPLILGSGRGFGF